MDLIKFLNDRRMSRIASPSPDPLLFPKYYKAKCIEVTLNEGNFIMIPSGWHHLVLSEGVNDRTGLNFAISFWKKGIFDELGTFNKSYDDFHEVPMFTKTTKDDFKTGLRTGYPFCGSTDDSHPSPVTLESLYDIMETCDVLFSDTPAIPSTTSEHIYDFTIKNVLFKSFLHQDLQLNGKHVYLIDRGVSNQNALSRYIPSVVKEYFDEIGASMETAMVWMNYGDVATYLHYDTETNYLFQVQGYKRIFIYPPSERQYLYMINPYPLEFLFSLRCIDNYIQCFEAVVQQADCDGIVDQIKGLTYGVHPVPNGVDIEHITSVLYNCFIDYRSKTDGNYNGFDSDQSQEIQEKISEIKICKRQKNSPDDLEEWSTTVDVKCDSTKLYYAKFVFIVFLNEVDDGNVIEFMNGVDRLYGRKGSIVIMPMCFTYAFKITKPESNESTLIIGYLYDEVRVLKKSLSCE